ncbi:MAG: DNA-binding Lrp family transcriptional regulator [Cocleimonas sp.]|jgi:DNA-binding Lrp family transcriptional regulator
MQGPVMYTQVLFLKTPKLSPEAKYFLMVLIKDFGLDNEISLTVAELVKRFCVTRTVVVKSFKQWKELGYISTPSNSTSSGRGRPRNSYYFTSLLKEELARTKKYSTTLSYGHLLIEDLLYSENDMRRHEPLMISHRLLLCVMIVHCQAHGVVKSMSYSDLSKLTGMSRSRIRTQINTLTKLKYVLRRVPGINNNNIFGRVKGVFFLDVNKKYDIDHKSYSEICIKHICYFNDHNLYNVKSLFDLIKESSAKSLEEVKKSNPYICLNRYQHFHNVYEELWFSSFVDLLQGEENIDAIAVYFQYKLEEYIVYLLNFDNGNIPVVGHEQVKYTLDYIKEDMFPKGIIDPNEDGKLSNEENIVNFVFELVFNNAIRLSEDVDVNVNVNVNTDTDTDTDTDKCESCIRNCRYEILNIGEGKKVLIKTDV